MYVLLSFSCGNVICHLNCHDTEAFETMCIVLSSTAIELNPNYVRAILRRAELYEKTDKLDEALEDYKTVLEKDPGIPAAREACMVSVSTSGLHCPQHTKLNIRVPILFNLGFYITLPIINDLLVKDYYKYQIIYFITLHN